MISKTHLPSKKPAELTSRYETLALHALVTRFCLGVLQLDPGLLAFTLLTLAEARKR
jgi:hypothetical protein